MTYVVRLTSQARRDMNKLPPRVLHAVAAFMAGDLSKNPQRVGKPLLAPFEGQHTARRGTFRLTYRIHDDVVEVEVIRVRHRADAYRPS